jgi:N-acyl-D-amino-acid deacylase
VLGRPTGMLQGHELTMSPFLMCPTYSTLSALPFPQRVAALRKPEVRDKVLAEVVEIDGAPRARVLRDWTRMFELSTPPDYEPSPDDSIAARAKAAGVRPEALAYDILLKDGGRRLLLQAVQNYAEYSLEPSLEMMRHKDTVLGLGDGGAHCGIVCDASYPTTMLAYWSRDRRRGERLTLPQVIKMLSADTAAAVGLLDRGRIAPGYKADINVIDYDKLRLKTPEVVHDLPTGGRRIVQRSEGYVATVLNGRITYRDGVSTGALPGRVVRGPRAAPRKS